MRGFLAALLAWPVCMAAQPAALAVVSAASGAAVIAPHSLATAYGTNLTTATAQASKLPLPRLLAGISVQVIDAAGGSHLSGILFASPTQVNFDVPSDLATGIATVRILNSTGVLAAGTVALQQVAPALFTANPTGLAAAAAATFGPNGAPAIRPAFQCDQNGVCAPVAVNAGSFLELFGSGIRGRSDLAGVSVTIAGMPVTPLYAGPQNAIPGLDQVNVQIPSSLRGAGIALVVLTVDGQPANLVYIVIQ